MSTNDIELRQALFSSSQSFVVSNSSDVACRSGKSYEYDIVEGAMVDDTIFNYIQDFIDKRIDREKFWVMVKFKYPTHQISFHTARALDCLTFERSYVCIVQY